MSRRPPPQDDPLAQRQRPPAALAQPADPGPLWPAPADPPPSAPAPGQAAGVKLPREGTMGHRILTVLRRSRAPLAIWQVAQILDIPDHCISQRFSELVSAGAIYKTGTTNLRPISERRCETYDYTPLSDADRDAKLARDGADDYDPLYDREGNLRQEWRTVRAETAPPGAKLSPPTPPSPH